jgi:hypothetical protein
MINKKMIPGIIIFVIMIIIIIVIIYNYNKKNKENKQNSDKLQQCNQEVQKCKVPLNNFKQQLQKSLNDKQMVISNLEKQKKAEKFKLAKTRHFSRKHGITYQKTMSLLKSINAPLGKGKRLGVGSSTESSTESLEEMLSEIKGDMRNNDSAEQFGEIGDATVDLIEAIYDGIQDGFTEESKNEIYKAVGVGLVDIIFACNGCGFLIGPFNKLISIFTKKKGETENPSGSEIAQELYKDIFNTLKDNDMANDISGVQTQLDNITNSFLQSAYGAEKSSTTKVLCPTTTSNGTNLNVIQCMTNDPNTIGYDPSGVTPFSSGNTDNSRRSWLTVDPGNKSGLLKSSLEQLALGETIGQASTAQNVLDSINVKYGVNGTNNLNTISLQTMVDGYPLYVNIIMYYIIYYQEMALYNAASMGGVNNPNYMNPYYYYEGTGGNPIQIGLMFLYSNSRGSNYLLNSFYNYIENIFITYMQKMSENQYGGDGYDEIVLTDQAHNDLALFSTPCSNGKTFTQLISLKYNDSEYAYQIYNNSGSSMITKYLAYFHEFMNFPLDTYLMFLKIAGVAVTCNGNPATSNDLFNAMIWDIYVVKGITINRGMGKLTPPTATQPIINYDTSDYSRGYPFGLNRPSFAEANNIGNVTPNDSCTDSSKICLAATDYYNNYCTPPVGISPGSTFDATIFNIPGDSGVYTKNMSCVDSSANIVKSCVFPRASPGKVIYNSDSTAVSTAANPGTRTAYCMNTVTGEFSTLQNIGGGTPPPRGTEPSNPPSGYCKCWTISMNPTIGNTYGFPFSYLQIILKSDGTWNSSYWGIDSPTWSSSSNTLSFTLNGQQNSTSTITFDSYQNITSLSGILNIPNPIVSSLPYYLVAQPNTPQYLPSSGYKCWEVIGNDGGGSNLHVFRIDTAGNYTIDGNPVVNPIWSDTSLTFTLNETNDTQFFFGENQSIILGKILNLYLYYFNKTIQPYVTSCCTAAPVGYKKKWVLQTNSAVSGITVDSNGDFGACYNGAGGCSNISNYSGGILNIKWASVYNGTQDSYVVFGANETIVDGQYAGQPLIGLPYKYQIMVTS